MIKTDEQAIEISGSGGGGKKGGGGSSADNTLTSTARARIVEAISEGPIFGLANADGAKAIYFDETPLVGSNGELNFDNVEWTERLGNPDDDHIQGSGAVESLNSVEVAVKSATGSVTRTITNPNVDAVRVIVRIDSLFSVDDKGQAQLNDLHYKIELRPFGENWIDVVDQNLVKEKATSPVQIAHKIELPINGAPWDIRITKITTDSTDDKDQSSMTFESFTNLIEGRFTYPHTALIGLNVEAESIGQAVPERAYLVKGRIISVPDNYDENAGTYSGVWTGNFKQAWTNNPAWIFYDLLENDRYGLGEFISAGEISNLKWRLYSIGQYCDELIPSGFKDDSSNDIMERRFTFNGILRDRKDAYNVLQQITTSFRGMGYWALGQIFATADMPSDPIKLVTPANVIDGSFKYSSTALKARHTVAMVRWNDPNDFFRTSTELVIDNDALSKFGWREKRVDMLGCTSRGLAHRYGKWLIDVGQNETETIEYRASFDHMDVAPGDIIAVADPRKASVRMGGRIISHVADADPNFDLITLDAETAFINGENYQISLTMPSGEIQTHDVDYISPDNTSVRIPSAISKAATNSMFIITGSDVAPKQYRIISINEAEDNIFQITALFHDPNKYARIEQNLQFQPISYSRDVRARGVENLVASEISFVEDGLPKTKIVLSWTPPSGVVVREYAIQMTTPTEVRKFVSTTKNQGIDIFDLERGDYTFYVTTIDRNGRSSIPKIVTHTVVGTDGISEGAVESLRLTDEASGTIFSGKDIRIAWRNLFPVNSGEEPTAELDAMYDYNTVKVYDEPSNSLLRTVEVRGNTYTYSFDFNLRDCDAASLSVNASRNVRFEVSVTSKRGNTSLAKILNVTNPVPEASIPTVTFNNQTISVSTPPSAETDVRGMKVWIEESTGFNPNILAPKFDGAGTFFSWTGLKNQEYFVRAGYYDYFDGTISISTEVAITLPDVDPEILNVRALAAQAVEDAREAKDNFDDIQDLIATEVAELLENSETGFAYTDSVRDALMSSTSTGNIVLSPTGRDGLGAWVDVDLSASVPVIAEVGEQSFSATGDDPRESIPRYGNINGRTFRFTAWVNSTGPWEPAIRGRAAGTTDDFSLIPTSLTTQPATSGWELITIEFTPTVDTAFWMPAIENSDHVNQVLLFWDMNLEDISGVSEVNATLQNEYRTAVDNDIAIALSSQVLSAEIATLEGGINQQSAVISSLGEDVEDLETYVASSFSTQVQAGGSTAFLGLFAYDSATKSYSLARIAADDIILDGDTWVNGKLLVGGGSNLLENSDYSQGLAGHRIIKSGAAGADSTISIRANGSSWAGEAHPTLMIYQNSGDSTGYARYYIDKWDANSKEFTARTISVIPGETYMASAHVSTHRCSADIRIYFRDANGIYISGPLSVIPRDVRGSSINPELWDRYFVSAEAPANAAYAQIIITKQATTAGSGNSYMFIHKPMLERTTPTAVGPSIWSNGAAVLIDGGNIVAESIQADKLDVNELSAITANIGLFKSSTSGERIEISDDGIKVYDSSNNIRVKIGDLS